MKPYEIPDPSNPKKKLPLVMVEWVDARGSSGWEPFFEMKDLPLATCITVGFLIHADRTRLVVGTTSQMDGSQWAEVASIPRTWQVKITKLGVVENTN